MRDFTLFGLSTVATVILAKFSVFAQIIAFATGSFGFLQSTAGLWYPISISISSLGFRTELISQGLALGLFVSGTLLYIAVKAETLGDRVMAKLRRK